MMIRQYLAPGGYVVSLQNCINEETIAGIVGWGRTLGAIASSSRWTAASRGMVKRGAGKSRRVAHGVSRGRGAWPDLAAGAGDLPAGRAFRQRQVTDQPVGRALVEAGGQRDGATASPPAPGCRQQGAGERRDPALSPRVGSEAIRVGQALGYELEEILHSPPEIIARAGEGDDAARAPTTSSAGRDAEARRRAPPLDGPGHDEGPAHRDRVPQRLRRARGRGGRHAGRPTRR